MAANNAAESSSAPRLNRATSGKDGGFRGRRSPARLHSRLVDPLQETLRPIGGEFRLREHLQDLGAEGLDVRRRYVDALAFEEALGIRLGLKHACVVEGLGLR